MTNVEQYINNDRHCFPPTNTDSLNIPKRCSRHLLVDKYLSEYKTEQEKKLVMLNILLMDSVPKENSNRLVNSGTVYKVMREGKLGRDQLTELFNYLQRTKADKSELFSKDYRELTNTPKNLSDFNNDLNFVQILDLENYYDKNEIDNIILNISLDNIDLSGYATQEYVLNQINNLIDGAPEALNTLKEITDKLSNDDDIVNLILNLINQKADKSDIEILDIDTNGHEYVDLGLPSGTLWATMNVGATSETDYGNYYQYGKGANLYLNTYNQSNYSGLESPLDLSVDTARQEWGGQWHTPTKELLEELINNTTYEWVTNYKNSGINGGTFTSSNGIVLFFPAFGESNNGRQYNIGYSGHCWSSSPAGNDLAYNLIFNRSETDVYEFNRNRGYSIRPVTDSLVKISLKDKVLQLEQSLATVATTGSYNDLLDLPTNISSFTNDVGYLISHLDISSKAENSDLLQTNELVQQLLNKILLLESKLENIKHEILTQEMYDNLQQYDPYTVYFIVEQLPPTPVDPTPINKNYWAFGDEFPIIFSEEWTFGDGFPIIFSPGQESLEEDPYAGHEYVEIGGLKWATMNIGASQPSDYGLYFAWGDTQGYTAEQVGSGEGQKYFGWADYKYGNGTSSPDDTGMTKYNATDGKTVLEASDDAAVANWGGSWRMPTTAEFQELYENCTYVWTTMNGVDGMLFTSNINGNTLFFPAAGRCFDGSVEDVGYSGNCWSSSLSADNRQSAYSLLFNSDDAYWDSLYSRRYGFAVRPVIG